MHSRKSRSQAAQRIGQFIKRKPTEKLTALLHHVSASALKDAFLGLRPGSAQGVDGMTWQTYAEGLGGRLTDLHRRVHSGAYRATPLRRVNAPGPDGGTCPLAVPALEDKIVQKAVVDNLLEPIYEAEFLDFSYGFRPGRGASEALDALGTAIARRKINWILAAQVVECRDRIDRARLSELLQRRIGDRRVLRLIGKWLRAGVLEDGHWSDPSRGTAQRSLISTVLANVYLHYVLDTWVQRTWRPQVARGDMIVVRYARDFVVGFQYRSDAKLFRRDAQARFAGYGLDLRPGRTALVELGRRAAASRKQRGEARPETFEFLGFTHYPCRTRGGKFELGRKATARRVSRNSIATT